MGASSAQPERYDRPQPEPRERPEPRREFHHAQSSMGAVAVIGQVVKTAGILAPLVIGEFVKDPDQRWRLIRMSSVATALVSQGLFTQRIQQERKDRDERRECRR